MIGEFLPKYRVPALALTVMENGGTVLKKTYGYADVENGIVADDKSMFYISSCTKAFTSLLAAMAVQEGRIGWDTPVNNVLPCELRFFDSTTTRLVSMRDMAAHMTGLPRHDFMQDSCETREQLVHRLRYLRPVISLRERSEYQNQVYVALGWVLEQLYGRSYEQLIVDKIADPLGMEVRFRGMAADDERLAVPYRLDFSMDGITRTRLEHSTSSMDNPCGGLILTNDALERWLMFLNGGGELYGTRLIDEKAFETWIKPVYTYEVFGADSLLRGYALGWNTQATPYGLMVSHGGVQAGYQSDILFYPKSKNGLCVVTNCLGIPMSEIVRLMVTDVLAGQGKPDYESFFLEKYAGSFLTLEDAPEVRPTAPTFVTGSEVGIYADDGYGELAIVREQGDLVMRYYSQDYPLVHLTGNYYVATHPLGMKLTLLFEPDLTARVSALTLQVHAGCTATAEFTRKGGPAL